MSKVRLKKLLICILIVITLFNFSFTSVVRAANETNVANTTQADAQKVEEEHNALLEGTGVMDGIAGILSWIPRLMAVTMAGVFNIEAYALAISGGTTATAGTVSAFITPFDIIFNKFNLTNINVFTISDLADQNGLVATIRKTVSMWYYLVNAVATAILLVILVIVAIKMATVTLSEDKARMKIMFKDWLVSAALVLFMTFIVIGIINVNNALVQAVQGSVEADIADAVEAVRNASLSVSHILGMGATITYILLTILTFVFLVKYIFRFFKAVILIVISPLVPLTYPVSKMNSDKAGALNTWLYEFIDTVFTQLIHCVVYTVIVGTAFKAFAASTDVYGIAALAPAVIAIFAMFFVWPAEKLIRKLIGLDKNSGGVKQVIKSIANGARNTTALVNSVSNATQSGAGAVETIGAVFGQNLENRSGGESALPIDSGAQNPAFRLPAGANGANGLNGVDGMNGLNGLPSGGNRDGISTSDSQLQNDLLSGIGGEGDGAIIALPPAESERLDRLNSAVEEINSTQRREDTEEEISTHTITEEETFEEISEEGEGDTAVALAPNGDGENLEELKDNIGKTKDELLDKIKTELGLDVFEENQQTILEGLQRIEDSINEAKSLEEARQIAEAEAGKPTEEFAAACLAAYEAEHKVPALEAPKDGKAEIVNVDVDAEGDDTDKDALEMAKNALVQRFSDNPEVKDETLDLVRRVQGIRGEAELEADISDEGLAEYAVNLMTTNTGAYKSNFDAAARQLQGLADADLMTAMDEKGTFVNENLAEEQRRLAAIVSGAVAQYDPKMSGVVGGVEIQNSTDDVIKKLEAGKK